MNDPFEVLAPWDCVPFFQPISRVTATTGSAAVKILKADPNRIGILFSVDTGQVQLNTVDNTTQLAGQPNGLTLSGTGTPYIMLLFKDVGPLTMLEWWVHASTSGNVLTAWEIKLKEWPNTRGDGRPNGRKASAPRPAVSPGRDRFDPTVGAKP